MAQKLLLQLHRLQSHRWTAWDSFRYEIGREEKNKGFIFILHIKNITYHYPKHMQ
jgi:hypothetical protein